VAEDADLSDSSAAESVRLLLARADAAGTDEIAAEVKKQASNGGMRPAARLALFAGAALGAATAVADAKAPRTLAVLRALAAGKDAPPAADAQAELLRALEGFASRHKETTLKAVPLLLQALYDADVLDEASVLAWAAAPGGSPDVRAKAKPFVEWLQNAEEDDDDEGEDEDDEEAI
jgi:hypothetical protein